MQAILAFCDTVHCALVNGKLNLSVFIDFKKAFDTVLFEVLLGKLNHYGVTGVANEWFANYLTGRTQITEVNSVRSPPRAITVGVPQGSVAGPFLFLILINDLYKATAAKTILFSDDTTLQITGTDQRELFDSMNKNLANAEIWFAANYLTLNSLKTKYILYADKNEHLHDIPLTIGGTEIE